MKQFQVLTLIVAVVSAAVVGSQAQCTGQLGTDELNPLINGVLYGDSSSLQYIIGNLSCLTPDAQATLEASGIDLTPVTNTITNLEAGRCCDSSSSPPPPPPPSCGGGSGGSCPGGSC